MQAYLALPAHHMSAVGRSMPAPIDESQLSGFHQAARNDYLWTRSSQPSLHRRKTAFQTTAPESRPSANHPRSVVCGRGQLGTKRMIYPTSHRLMRALRAATLTTEAQNDSCQTTLRTEDVLHRAPRGKRTSPGRETDHLRSSEFAKCLDRVFASKATPLHAAEGRA